MSTATSLTAEGIMLESKQESILGILIFDDVEVLDFTGPFEVFSVCRRVVVDHKDSDNKDDHDKSPFHVSLIAEAIDRPVITVGGMKVLADYSFETCPALDVLVVPGGMGTRQERFNDKIIHFIQRQQRSAQKICSVCTGALLLAQAGLLDGLTVTTHWQALDLLKEWYPKVTVDSQHSVISQRDGKIYTSAGISAGIDMSLMVLKDIHGEEVARRTAKHMEYSYPESNKRRIDF